MITRIVKLNFQSDKVPEFLEIFNQNKQLLEKSDGCTSLEIFNCTSNTDTYFTISTWSSDNKAEAWTLNTVN